MSRLILLEQGLPTRALGQLEAAEPAAAWLIEPEGGRVLAANGTGADLLGIRPGATTATLDAAMPALARLRALAAVPSSADVAEEPLILWGPGGAIRVVCRVEIISFGMLPAAVVISRTGRTAAEATPAQPQAPSQPQAQPHAPAPALFVGDDAAKLKEIARRIREGQTKARAAAKAAAPLPADDTGGKAHAPRDEDAPTGGLTVSKSLRAGLAHELMTPLSAIAAAAEIMKDQRFGPLGTARYVGYATDIHASAQHALGVIERMLGNAEGDLADTTGGALVSPAGTLNFAEIDAGAMLETSVSQVAPLAERAGVALTLELAPRLPRVVADATSLRQIVFNLLTNALKFTERGGRVTVAARYNGDGPLRIAITDTGRGMSRREVEGLRGGQVPRPERRGGTRASAGGSAGVSAGLGLGLPLVRALAAANGAELVIESEPGRGTSACVVFGKDRVIPV
jgi:hypothetical protein